jgi:hypothetical protein
MAHAEILAMSDATAQSEFGITIQDRLEVGYLTVDEVCALKKRSRSGFYADVKAGLVEIKKQGRKSVIRGPIARRYINSETSAKPYPA